MRIFFVSIAIAIFGNVLYHVAQKSIPASAPPLLSLLVAYGVAFAATAAMLPFAPDSPPVAEGLSRMNWANVVVGIAIVAVELGFLLAYRAGWKISVGSVAVNGAGALLLIPAGLIFFRERPSIANVAGVVLCLAGLFLIARK